MKNKFLLGFGTLTSALTPIIAVVACSSSEAQNLDEIPSEEEKTEFHKFVETHNLNGQVLKDTFPRLESTFKRLLTQIEGLNTIDKNDSNEKHALNFVDENLKQENEKPGAGWGEYPANKMTAKTKYLLHAFKAPDGHIRSISFWRIKWFNDVPYFTNIAEEGSGSFNLIPILDNATIVAKTDDKVKEYAIEKTAYDSILNGGVELIKHLGEYKAPENGQTEGTHLWEWAKHYATESSATQNELVVMASTFDDKLEIVEDNGNFWLRWKVQEKAKK